MESTESPNLDIKFAMVSLTKLDILKSSLIPVFFDKEISIPPNYKINHNVKIYFNVMIILTHIFPINKAF